MTNISAPLSQQVANVNVHSVSGSAGYEEQPSKSDDSKGSRKRTTFSEAVKSIDWPTLQSMFHLPLAIVAAKFGVCENFLKKRTSLARASADALVASPLGDEAKRVGEDQGHVKLVTEGNLGWGEIG